MLSSPTRRKLQIGFLTLDQLDEVLAIERASFAAAAWSRRDFTRLRLAENGFCVAATRPRGQSVRGYCVYRLCPHSVRLDRLAVHPAWRRTGVGRELVEHLVQKLGRQDLLGRVRRRILCDVPERQLAAQLFLRACGFRCVHITRQMYAGEDGLRFVRPPGP